MGKEAYLNIEGVTKQFGTFTALRNVSLEVYESEFVCFLGPSGCGKTTLLRAIAGLDIQSSGRIFQAGRDISALPASERDFGIVFQSYALFPNLTVRRNIAFGLENQKVPREKIRARVEELLALVGLAEHGDKYPSQISGGQQQRVALARAMATSPGLLLLDEPLSALDARVRLALRHEIKELQRKLGVTTIMVTHDQEEALTMADRIVVMDHGVIRQTGTSEEIYTEPADVFVADFIGAMNFLPSELSAPGELLLGEKSFRCRTDLSAGTAVTAAIRPEDIVAYGVSDDEANTVSVRIDYMEFVGSYYRVDLGGPGLSLRAEFSINLVRRMGLETGKALPVKLPLETLRIYARNR